MKCFTLMPFDARFNNVYDAIERTCCDCRERFRQVDGNSGVARLLCDLHCERADQDLGATTDLVAKMKDKIRGAAFCIADVTSHNQNVMWELGFAMALDKPVVIITQERAKIGFDLKHVYNIEYSPDDLRRTLQEPLLETIETLSADISTAPSLAASAKALAMSSGSPTYFLDANYVIHYMNEAAAVLFSSKNGEGGSTVWVGRTLRDFIDSFSRRLKNLPAIEKNLQVQKEEIARLIAAGRPDLICPYNIERVVFDSQRYGELELQKTGVAVRDPATGEISGWVVSFNAVRASNPEKFASFHLAHRQYIEGQLFDDYKCRTAAPNAGGQLPGPSLTKAPAWPDGSNVQEWISRGCRSPRDHVAINYAEKQECFDFCAAVMKHDSRYGLESVEYLDDWFFDYHKADFIMLKTHEHGECVGVFRIHYNHDVKQYKGQDGCAIDEWVIRDAEDGQPFADVGAYLHPTIDGEGRLRSLATMLGCAVDICEKNGQVHLYAQVPARLESRFKSFLFRRAGRNFSCPGWRQPNWTPMVLKCLAYPRCYAHGNWDLEYAAELMGEEFSPAHIDREFVRVAAEAYHERDSERVV